MYIPKSNEGQPQSGLVDLLFSNRCSGVVKSADNKFHTDHIFQLASGHTVCLPTRLLCLEFTEIILAG